MKTINFVIFFTIVLAVYGLINYYIFIRGWQSIPSGAVTRTYYLILFLFFSLAFIAGRILERFYLSLVSDIFVWIGSFWLAAMLYFFLIIIILDLSRLVNHFVTVYPSFVTFDYARAKQTTLLFSIALVAVIILLGHINALSPRIRTFDLTLPKNAGAKAGLNIVAASDIHLGTIIGRSRLDRLVKSINELKPDIVLLPGDIVDEDLGPVIRENLGEALRNIEAPLGVYACTGNHEYIGGVEPACRYLVEHGIRVLRDSAVCIENSFYILGREDREISGFARKKRKTLEELMLGVNQNLPVILLDHQPFQLARAAANGIDLQISGHTHHGQLWPLNFITNAIYELSWGYKKIENTHFYISCGFGSWGPPVRVGNRPEIMNFRLIFDSHK